MSHRIVFDTTTVVSALIFGKGRLSRLRSHWQAEECIPLLSRSTASELTRVLAYPKFCLSAEEQRELLAEYLPFCKIVEQGDRCPEVCRDEKDQPFLDLAQSGKAEALVSGDKDLLALAGRTSFIIEAPESYRLRVK